MNSSASLQDLNDIFLPAEVAWWPLAPAWYVLAVILSIFLLWFIWRKWRQWKTDRYRRAALKSLHALQVTGDWQALQQIPELMKRAALSCWPRSEVAALSGRQWHEFLDRSSQSNRFCTAAGSLLDRLAYSGGESLALDKQESDLVFSAAEFWLKRHRREFADG